MKLWSALLARCSRSSRNWDRCARSGSGSIPKDCPFRRAKACTARSAGLLQRIPPSIMCSPTRCMLAHMLTEPALFIDVTLMAALSVSICASIHRVGEHMMDGAYAYGKCRHERYVDEQGRFRKRTRHLPQAEWAVLLPDHHPGFIDWATYQANQARIDSNVHPEPHQAGGAVREGAALLQGLATCGKCGRHLHTHYSGRNASPGYHCSGKDIVHGRGVYCLNIGGVQIDKAVTDAFLRALTPAAVEATEQAMRQLEADHDAALGQWLLAVERASYEAERAERQYRAVEPENRLVAGGLETEWEKRLRDLAAAEAELERREQQRPRTLSEEERKKILSLGADLHKVWAAPTTTDRDRKELLRTLLEEVIVTVDRPERRAHLTLRWRGGTLTEFDLSLP